jgi:acetyl esterase/lipase
MKCCSILLTAAALTLTTHSFAQVALDAKPVPDGSSVKTPPGYTTILDKTYVKVGDWQGKMDLYLPPKSKTPSPVVIKIHGGGYTHGSRVSPGGIYFRMGFALINVEYRFTQAAPAPAAVEDSRCALKYVIDHAAELNIDPHRIVLQGGSAGGHLVLMTGLLGNDHRFESNCPGNTNMSVAAIVDDYGPTDYTQSSWSIMSHNKSVVLWLGSHVNDEAFKASVSPITYIQPNSPPVLIVHGALDHSVPMEQSDVLEQKLKGAGVKTEILVVQGAGHGGFTHDQDVLEEEHIQSFLKSIQLVK